MDEICSKCVWMDDCRVKPDNIEECKPHDYSNFEEEDYGGYRGDGANDPENIASRKVD